MGCQGDPEMFAEHGHLSLEFLPGRGQRNPPVEERIGTHDRLVVGHSIVEQVVFKLFHCRHLGMRVSQRLVGGEKRRGGPLCRGS